MNKKIIIVVFLTIVVVGGWWGHRQFNAAPDRRQIVSVLPEDAVYFLQTENLTQAWREVSETNIWRHLITTVGFEFLQQIDTLLNENLLHNGTSKYIFKNRPTLMAAYMTTPSDYDFLYVIDLQKTTYIKQILDKLLKLGKTYKVTKLKYKGQQVIKLIDKQNKNNRFFITALDNLLLMSFSYDLIQKSIDRKQDKHWINSPDFVQINDKLGEGLIQFYLNYDKLPDYAGIYFSNARQDLKLLTRQLLLSGFDISHDDERIIMDGYTLTDSLPSYMNALLDVKPGKIKSYDIISDQVAMSISLGFKNFNLFYQSLLDQYAQEGKNKKAAYRSGLKKMESFFKIDLQKDLFDWIGQEITLVKLRSKRNQKTESAVMLIDAKDITDAQNGLYHISEQIRKRSPFKFKTYTYKNFDIYYLHQKGFFKTILGNLFEKIDKPYYTFIENYVVFSNSEAVLKDFIDDYITGNTLSHDDDFVDFNDDLNAKTNVNIYIQMPKLYDILKKSLSGEGRKMLNEKKNLMLSFSRIGFQMIAKDDIFKTLLLIDHDQKALEKDRAEKLAVQLDKNTHQSFFEDLQFKISFPDSLNIKDGKYKKYDEGTRILQAEGRIKDNLPVGIWRTYYPSGNLQSVVNYDENGDVNGELFYYFDKKPKVIMAKMNFDKDLLQGIYKEYWANGAQKAKLNYKNGRLHGDAFYYYPSGQIKVKGKYKKGEKKGKWLFYDPDGNLIDKKRYSGFLF